MTDKKTWIDERIDDVERRFKARLAVIRQQLEAERREWEPQQDSEPDADERPR